MYISSSCFFSFSPFFFIFISTQNLSFLYTSNMGSFWISHIPHCSISLAFDAWSLTPVAHVWSIPFKCTYWSVFCSALKQQMSRLQISPSLPATFKLKHVDSPNGTTIVALDSIRLEAHVNSSVFNWNPPPGLLVSLVQRVHLYTRTCALTSLKLTVHW